MKRALLILLGVAVVSVPSVLAGKPAPPPPTGPWDIAYTSQTQRTGDLTLMQANGADKYVVYTVPDVFHYPRMPDWSHDGKYISFTVMRIEGRVMQLATRKTCVLYSPHGTSPQPMEFHPSFGEGVGDGHYVVAFTNYNGKYDLYIAEFTFQEDTCAVQWIQNVSGSELGEWGAAWSPIGTAQSTQLATILETGQYGATLRIYDIVMDANGHLGQAGTFVDYPLDSSLYIWNGLGGGAGATLQWSPDPNVLGCMMGWSPDGGVTKFYDIYSIDISTNPPTLTNLTNTEADEYYFDFRRNGDGIVAGNGDGIFLFPAAGGSTCIAPLERRKWPQEPAWNPTRW